MPRSGGARPRRVRPQGTGTWASGWCGRCGRRSAPPARSRDRHRFAGTARGVSRIRPPGSRLGRCRSRTFEGRGLLPDRAAPGPRRPPRRAAVELGGDLRTDPEPAPRAGALRPRPAGVVRRRPSRGSRRPPTPARPRRHRRPVHGTGAHGFCSRAVPGLGRHSGARRGGAHRAPAPVAHRARAPGTRSSSSTAAAATGRSNSRAAFRASG